MTAHHGIPALRVPITHGRIRMRGAATGALVADEQGESLGPLRSALAEAIRLSGQEPTVAFVSTCVRQVLDLYERAHKDWQTKKDDTIGFVYEAMLPTGVRLLMGDERVLSRLGKSH